ncbi:MAG: hypothetical protein ACK559_31140, partial [bacterium]
TSPCSSRQRSGRPAAAAKASRAAWPRASHAASTSGGTSTGWKPSMPARSATRAPRALRTGQTCSAVRAGSARRGSRCSAS